MANQITDIYGEYVFNDEAMKLYLPKQTYNSLRNTIDNGLPIDNSIADDVAEGMKAWALAHGATHFAHWFQPLSENTVAKEDAFIKPLANGRTIMSFTGKDLIKGEADGSSFPSGGIRETYRARGYTIWDCTSPAFIKETEGENCLLIPAVFMAYNGECLDEKGPLLRSEEALDLQTRRILKMFGKKVLKVTSSVGPEQEYFLVSREDYLKRKDLRYTGRTLYGAKPPKGQELDDHYYGMLKEEVSTFMKDLNNELWKLGIPAKTQHNEVAPGQHELATVYKTVNQAIDNNLVVMDTMTRVAKRHNLACLLAEKPFAGVNGSGKHNNWSFNTESGTNLLDPGKNPENDRLFLLFLAAVIKAVDDNAVLLRYAASNPGNDFRLGANEAPPAIVSIFLGTRLQDIIDQIIEKGDAKKIVKSVNLETGIRTLPSLMKDNTDRNRTSPFAFTGNKFEFRMVASSANLGCVNTALNVAVAESLREIADELDKSTAPRKAARRLIRNILTEHQRIVFNGNGYSEEWVKEAQRRGLPNLPSIVDAIPALTDKKTIAMYERHHILTKDELYARETIAYETYTQTRITEAKTMIDMARKELIPAIIKYEDQLVSNLKSFKEIGVENGSSKNLLLNLIACEDKANIALVSMEAHLHELEAITSAREAANFAKDVLMADMDSLRAPCDAAELLVPEDLWPIPTYEKLLFNGK